MKLVCSYQQPTFSSSLLVRHQLPSVRHQLQYTKHKLYLIVKHESLRELKDPLTYLLVHVDKIACILSSIEQKLKL